MLRKFSKVGLSLLLVLSFTNVLIASASNNLISNGGFEDYPGGGTGEFWSFGTIGNTPQSFQATVVSSGAYEGSKAQLLAEDGASLAGDTLRIMSEYYPVVQGQGLTMSFKANIKTLSNSYLEPSILFIDSIGNQVGEQVGNKVTRTTSGYETFTVRANLPKDADTFTLRFDAVVSADGGQHEMLLDGVEVVATTNTFPVTGETEVGVLGGELEFSTVPGSFSNVNLDFNQVMKTQTTGTARVTDNTGEAKGWSLKVSSTDFLSDPLDDPSAQGETFVLSLPASSVTLQPKAINYVAGQQVDPINGPIGKSVTLSSSDQTLVSANPGFGSGAYSIENNYDLVIPKTLEIVSQSGTGSKFSVGDTVGTRSGKYKATITFTIGTGL